MQSTVAIRLHTMVVVWCERLHLVLCTNEDLSPLHNGEKTECGVERSHEMVWNIVQTVLTWLSDGCDGFEVE